jgi:acylphosphatase
MPESTPTRTTILFSGRVQGVGFRYTTRDISRNFAVTGYVENLPDGSVRVVAEGETGEVDRFIDAVSLRMQYYVSGMDRHASPATGEFSRFEIRR